MSDEKSNVRPIDRAKEKVTEKVDQTREVVADRLASAREKFQDVAGETSEKLRERTADARAVAKERYEATSEQLRHKYEDVQKGVDELLDDVGEFVRDNPGKAVLMAAGAGFLLGLLFRRRGD